MNRNRCIFRLVYYFVMKKAKDERKPETSSDFSFQRFYPVLFLRFKICLTQQVHVYEKYTQQDYQQVYAKV